jgi:hypothetical protein
MPIVGGADNRLQIQAELIDNITAGLSKINRGLDQMQERRRAAEAAATRASVAAARSSIGSWTEFRSAYSTVLDVVRLGNMAWDQTAGKFQTYALQARDVARTLGSTTEEASKLIQVADDLGVTYESLTTSMKLAQKDGFDPSISGLAKLSDEYLKLQPGIARTQFLLDRFGKSGTDMGRIMEKGGDWILKYADALDKSLIVTEEAAQAAEDLRIAQDNLGDAWDALTYQAGPPLLDLMGDIVAMATANLKAVSLFVDMVKEGEFSLKEFSLGITPFIQESMDVLFDVSKAGEDVTDSFEGVAEGIDIGTAAIDRLAERMKEVAQRNKEMLDFTLSYADFQRDYARDHAEAMEAVGEAQENLAEAMKEGADAETMSGLKEALAEARQGVTDLEITWHEKTQRMIYDMILAKISVDGLTDAEYTASLEIAKTMGILTQAEVDQAQKMMDVVNATIQNIQHQEALRASVENTTQAYQKQASAAKGVSQEAMEKERSTRKGGSRDSGGPGMAGTAYVINPKAAPEIFVPNTNGTFIPNADKASMTTKNISITINNPKAETSENDIRRLLKHLSYVGSPL